MHCVFCFDQFKILHKSSFSSGKDFEMITWGKHIWYDNPCMQIYVANTISACCQPSWWLFWYCTVWFDRLLGYKSDRLVKILSFHVCKELCMSSWMHLPILVSVYGSISLFGILSSLLLKYSTQWIIGSHSTIMCFSVYAWTYYLNPWVFSWSENRDYSSAIFQALNLPKRSIVLLIQDDNLIS